MTENELGLHNIDKSFTKEIEETKAKIYDGSLRSGIKIEYDGTVVVLGDINAGSEVIAGENVIALGTIRGLAHAGATGNRAAIIVANEILAPQLRIADIITRQPDGEHKNMEIIPEMAFVKDDRMYIEEFLHR